MRLLFFFGAVCFLKLFGQILFLLLSHAVCPATGETQHSVDVNPKPMALELLSVPTLPRQYPHVIADSCKCSSKVWLGVVGCGVVLVSGGGGALTTVW